MDVLADPTHPGHGEHAAWVAEIPAPMRLFAPAFLDFPP